MSAVVGIKHIVAVAAGKGGVGKSTVTTNLALTLQARGMRVGVLDADIYGPSQPLLLGVDSTQKPQTVDDKYFIPVDAHGIQLMSMGLLIDEATPMVWRGPMIASALSQMLEQTRWNQLDCLLVDMPPGTGDIQLTLVQKFKPSGALIVTTPQDVALLDVRKAIAMFNKMNVPCLGLIENMATHTCSNCGQQEAIFGTDGAAQLATDFDCKLLGSLPLDRKVRESGDNGRPAVLAEKKSVATEEFSNIARQVEIILSELPSDQQSAVITKQ